MRPFFTAPVYWIAAFLLLVRASKEALSTDREIRGIIHAVLGGGPRPNLNIYLMSTQAGYVGKYFRLGSWLNEQYHLFLHMREY